MTALSVMLVTVLGGLGVFLLGMKHLSEGLQAVAGRELRRIMALATTHRAAGVGTGVVSTILVQSSSIISVMLVGFVSSGLMTLQQAINVIIGANIGTTATVWIVAFAPDPQVLGLAGLGLGGVLYFFVRGERPHNAGLAVLGLGLVFLGMYFMSKGVAPIRQSPDIQAVFARMGATTLGGVALVALVAAVFTAVIQSSAASIAIAMTLASQQLITYEMAIAVLFGANIGTTATAWLAAIGGTASARRTALAHTLSNVLGSLVFLPLVLPVFVPMGKALFPNWAVVTETAKGPMLLGVMAPIAVTDTVFSALRGLLFFPFVKPFAALVERLVPQKDEEKPHLSVLKMGVRLSPVIACDQALLEIHFMKESNLDLLACARRVVAGEADESVENHILHREDILDNVQREVTEFLGSIMTKRLPQDVAERARRLLRLTDELESISDECAQVLKVVRRLRRQKQTMSEASVALLLKVHDRVSAFAGRITPLIRSPRVPFDLEAVQAESTGIHEFIRDCRRIQLGRIGPEDPGSSIRVLGELDIINAYERVRAYYLNCAETLFGGKR
ncbi:MAG: Na/Pi cotransporter family protein [Kiritimatiellae bacterium]|nr:Na/Pi cotransporter family protein [Kiritimatiellia bacterium]